MTGKETETATRTLLMWTSWTMLLVTAALVWFSEFRPRLWEPCADVDRLTNTSELQGTKNVEEPLLRRESEFLFDWKRGDLEASVGQLNYHIMRSRGSINYAMNVYLKLERLYQPSKTWVEERLVDGDEISIQWSNQALGNRGSQYHVARLDFLGARPIRSTLWNSILTAPSQLINGTLAVTTYLVETTSNAGDDGAVKRQATEWLEAVVRRNREACAS